MQLRKFETRAHVRLSRYYVIKIHYEALTSYGSFARAAISSREIIHYRSSVSGNVYVSRVFTREKFRVDLINYARA